MQYISWHTNIGHVGEIFSKKFQYKNYYHTDPLEYRDVKFIVLYQSFIVNDFTAGIFSCCNDNSGKYQYDCKW